MRFSYHAKVALWFPVWCKSFARLITVKYKMNCQQKHLYLCPAQSQTNQFHSSRYCCRGEKSKQWIMIFYVNLFRHTYKIRNKASENVFEAAIFFLLSAGRGFYALATNDQIRTKAKLANTKQEKMPHKSGDQSRGKKILYT